MNNMRQMKIQIYILKFLCPQRIWIFPISASRLFTFWTSKSGNIFISLRFEWMNIWDLACRVLPRGRGQQIFISFYALNEWILARWGGRQHSLALAKGPEMIRNGRNPLFSLCFPCFSIQNQVRKWPGTLIFYSFFTSRMNEYLEPGGPWTRLG